MKAILDVPDAAVLATSPLPDLVEMFSFSSGEEPDVICLPIYDEGGPQFESPVASRTDSPWSGYDLQRTVDLIRNRYKNTQIYFSMRPDLPGLKAGHLSRRNQFNSEVSQPCIVNPEVQRVVIDFVHAAIDRFKPAGIIFDIVDIQGQTTLGEDLIGVTCFCQYCRDEMFQLARFDSSVLSGLESPLKLVLKATPTGISFVIPRRDMTEDQLVTLALSQKMITKADELSKQWATTVLRYVDVRSRVVGEAMGKLRQGIQERFPDVRVGAVLNFPHFDWTGGTDLEGMKGQVDEVWLDRDDLTAERVPPGMEIYAYLADRARYRIDALFEIISDFRYVQAMVSDGKLDDLNRVIQSRKESALRAQNLNKLVVNTCRNTPFLSGFVGAAINPKVVQRMDERLQPEIESLLKAQRRPQAIQMDVFIQYLQNLIHFAKENPGELGQGEIVGIAARMGLIQTG